MTIVFCLKLIFFLKFHLRPVLANSAKLGIYYIYKPGEEIDLQWEGVWCPAFIKVVDADGSVTVGYKGWDADQDEKLKGPTLLRISPKGTGVVQIKCWARLHKRLCLWPCTVFIRRLVDGSVGKEKGEPYLISESKVFVVPSGTETKQPLGAGVGRTIYKHPPPNFGVWIAAAEVTPFGCSKAERIQEGVSSKFCAHFEEAVNELEDDPASVNSSFVFHGTLEVSDQLVESEEGKKRKKREAKIDDVAKIDDSSYRSLYPQRLPSAFKTKVVACSLAILEELNLANPSGLIIAYKPSDFGVTDVLEPCQQSPQEQPTYYRPAPPPPPIVPKEPSATSRRITKRKSDCPRQLLPVVQLR